MLIFRYRFLIATIILSGLVQPLFAGKINLILSDVDTAYDGDTQSLQDMGSATGGNLVPAEADELQSTLFEYEGAVVEVMLPSDASMHIDLQLGGFPNLIDLSSNTPLTINTTGFGLDWFSSNDYFLRLKIDSVDVLLTNGVFFFTTEATVLSQALPQNLLLPEKVNLSFTASSPTVQPGATTSTASASGAVTISGTAVLVPEPITASLCTLLLAAGLAWPRLSA